MNALGIFYPTLFDRMSTVEENARKHGYEVKTYLHERAHATPLGDERCVWITRPDATPEDYASFAADLGAMGVPDFGGDPHAKRCYLTVFGETEEELEEALAAFREHGFEPDAELTTG